MPLARGQLLTKVVSGVSKTELPMTPPLDITPTLLETVLKAHTARAGSRPQPAYLHSILA